MIKQNIQKIKSEIHDIKLVIVTKSRTIDEIKEAIEAGTEIVGENRIQEAEEKYNVLKEYLREKKVEFHFIGHLQTNKAKKAVAMFDLIQSLDSLKLVKEIDKRAGQINKIQDVLIQINISKEKQKHGVMPEEVIDLVNEISKLDNIKVKGLMCMAPYFEDPEKTRPYFRKMKEIFDILNLEYLSMGMTNDYKIALEEGSNMIRIGRAIFGKRKY